MPCSAGPLWGGEGEGASPARVNIRAAGASFLMVEHQFLLDREQRLQIQRELGRNNRQCEEEGKNLHRPQGRATTPQVRFGARARLLPVGLFYMFS